jgi:hypothetical protein
LLLVRDTVSAAVTVDNGKVTERRNITKFDHLGCGSLVHSDAMDPALPHSTKATRLNSRLG